MVNAFEEASLVEQQSLEILRPFIKQRAFDGQFVVTRKGPLARELQRTVGDILYNSDVDTVYSAEVKAEKENLHDNFFLETWSNRERFTPGWMVTLKCDLLLYHFVEEDRLYIIEFDKLRRWAFHEGRIYDYPEKKQRKYSQLNDTWGRCVPIRELAMDLNMAIPFRPKEGLAA